MEKIKLERDEKILIQVRKHWFILAIELVGVMVAAIFPIFGALIVENVLTLDNLTSQVVPYILFGYAAWLLATWMIGFNIWTNYYLDIWTITNKRLIAVDQRGLFHRSTGSFRLERLQDMNVEINGIIATLLDFGTIQAQTAGGDEEEFKARGLPQPRELKATILGAADQLIKDQSPNNTGV